MDAIYFTDGYPREGCQVVIDVSAGGYKMSVVEPGGKTIESYGYVKSPRGIARMVEEWCNGFAPKLHHRLDQPASGSAVTE